MGKRLVQPTVLCRGQGYWGFAGTCRAFDASSLRSLILCKRCLKTRIQARVNKQTGQRSKQEYICERQVFETTKRSANRYYELRRRWRRSFWRVLWTLGQRSLDRVDSSSCRRRCWHVWSETHNNLWTYTIHRDNIAVSCKIDDKYQYGSAPRI